MKEQSKSEYIVLSPVEHDGKRYEIGETIELTDDQAKSKLDSNAPTIVPPASTLAKGAQDQYSANERQRLLASAMQRTSLADSQAAQADVDAAAKDAEAKRVADEAHAAKQRAKQSKDVAGEVRTRVNADLKAKKVDPDKDAPKPSVTSPVTILTPAISEDNPTAHTPKQ